MIGPRGLSQLMPLAAAISESPSALPPVFCQSRIDQMRAVVTADGEEVGVTMKFIVKGFYEFLVHRRLMIVVVVGDRDDAKRRRRPCS